MNYPTIRYSSIELILEEYFNGLNDSRIKMVIIGANSGQIKDFLTKYLLYDNVSAVLVEPVMDIFLQLKDKFSDRPGLFFENSAIDSRSGKKMIYKIKPCKDLPEWARGLVSFNKNVILNHGNQIKNIQRHIVKESVNCVTFDKLMSKYKLSEINLLQIDTEGYDYEILKSIDFKKTRPDIVIAEYLHLSFYQYFSLINLLRENNYQVKRNMGSFDMIGLDNNILH